MPYQPKRPLPEPICGSDPGSFAENTITVRLPQIGRRLLTNTNLPETAVTAIESLLVEIPDERLRPLPDTYAPDATAWNDVLRPFLTQNWLQPPWFVVETYFYRRIMSAVDYFATGIDPFAVQKQAGLTQTISSIRQMIRQAAHIRKGGWQPVHFNTLLQQALWGNQVDLSLWSPENRPEHEGVSPDDYLLVDEGTAVTTHLSSITDPLPRIDFIVDNAAFELVGDLCLVDYLLSSSRAAEVHLHVKLHPTFVSDATIEDVEQTITFLQQDEDAATEAMGERLRRHMGNGRLHLQTHPFWTSLHYLWHMPEKLRQEIANAHLVISKGDANYRRAVGDAHWPYSTPFAEIVSYFPAPILFLRTCKSNTLAGLLPNQAASVAQQDPDWLTNGKWGVIQFVGSVT